eukprot:GHVU01099760.1.p1 GENE.GHVU01099760.1~~GHVU01099760.1.p1  ORF type:complete len:342 (-),score=73.15 GHVU01099760.1:230-1255(-)
MLGGNTTILRDLEKKIGKFFGRDDALTCSSGYLACMSGVCAMVQEGDVVFTDNRAHASLRTGLKICGGRNFFFKHNNFVDLEHLIKKHRRKYKKAYILVESVYSMDGDLAHLPTAVTLARKYDLDIIIDEAHGMGVVGKTGRGLEEHFNLPGVAKLIVGTFSKSLSSVGGFICGSNETIQFSDFHAPGNVFSAPCSAYCAAAAIKCMDLIDEEPWRVTKAQENSKYFRHCLQTGLGQWPQGYPDELKYELEGEESTTVIPCVLPYDPIRLMDVTCGMRDRGYMLSAVAYPACPADRPRLRLTATSAYTKEHIETFVRTLIQVIVEKPPSESGALIRKLKNV